MRDPKRPSNSFKTELKSTLVPNKRLAEPPDLQYCFSSPVLGADAASWTSKGYATSTRERFPRARRRWEDG